MKKSKPVQFDSEFLKNFGLLTLAAFWLVGLIGCSPGFEASNGSALSQGALGGNPSGGQSNPPSAGSGADWNAIELDASIDNSIIGSHKVLELDRASRSVIIRLPFLPGLPLVSTQPVPVAGIPGATSQLTVIDNSTYWVFRLPVETWLKGVQSLPKGRLPNGDRLPSIPDGELPSTGLAIDRNGQLRGSVYLGPTVIAFFIATRFDPILAWEVPIRNSSRTRTYGHFAAVPAKAGASGGFFMALALPSDLARAIDDLL